MSATLFWTITLNLLATVAAALSLFKEWKEHRWWARLILAGIVPIAMLISSYLAYRTDREAREQVTGLNTQVSILNGQVQAGRDENQRNSEGFRKSFAQLYDKFSDLQSKVQSEKLQRELSGTKAELEATRKALTPPKVPLSFSFFVDPENMNTESHSMAFPMKDGAVTVELVALNKSESDALDGEYVILICERCRFFEEPAGFIKVAGAPDYQRNYPFQHILSKSNTPKVSLRIIPPRNAREFQIGFSYRCRTCVSSPSPQTGTVYVLN